MAQELVDLNHGLKKYQTLADKLIELSEVTHVMEQNDTATDENNMFPMK